MHFSFGNSNFYSPNATDNYSTVNPGGNWTNAATWDRNPTIPNPAGGGGEKVISINHNVTYTETGVSPWLDPWVWTNKVTINIAANITLTINADVDIQNNFTFNIATGGKLIVNGNLKMKNNVDGTVNGEMNVTGNLTVAGGGTSAVDGSGSIVVGGTITDPNSIILSALTSNISRYLIANNGNWSSASSWSLTVGGQPAISAPNQQCNTFITANYQVNVDIANAKTNNVTINSNGKLNINQSSTITISGTLTNSGSIIINSNGNGGLIYNGAANGTVNHYLTAGTYHYVSSPFTDAAYSVFGTSKNYYFYKENETTTLLAGWKQISSGSLSPGKAYALYPLENYTYALTGSAFNNGNVPVSVFNSNNGGGSNTWNLIGNPYPCNISADSFLTTNGAALTSATLYFWDDDHTNGSGYASIDYLAYNSIGSQTGGNGKTLTGAIGTGQGFFVKATTGGTVNFTNAMKSASTATYFKSGSEDNIEIKRATLAIQTGSGKYKDILIGFISDASIGIDNKYDAPYLQGDNSLAFYSMIGNERFAIQGLPEVTTELTVKIGVFSSTEETFTFEAKELLNFDVLTDVILEDKQENEFINLREDNYTFTSNGTCEDRFVLHFVQNQQVTTKYIDASPYNVSNEASWSNGIPDSRSKVVIEEGKQIFLSESFECRDFIVEAGGSVILGEQGSINSFNTPLIISDGYKSGIMLDQQKVNQIHLTIDIDKSIPYYLSFPLQSIELNNIIQNNELSNNEVEFNSFSANEQTWESYSHFNESIYPSMGYRIISNSVPGKISLTSSTVQSPIYFYTSPGYNFLGNPYISGLDWGTETQRGWEGTSYISPSIWYQSLGIRGGDSEVNFAAYNRNSGIGVNDGNRVIPPLWGFWIKSDDYAVVSVNNDATTCESSANDISDISAVRIKISSENLTDETALCFHSQAGNEFDGYDTEKMFSPSTDYPQIYTRLSDKNLAINTMPEDNDSIFDLSFKSGGHSDLTISLTKTGTWDAGSSFYLEDTYLSEIHEISNAFYSFESSEIMSDTRFKIHVKKSNPLNSRNLFFESKIYSSENIIYIQSNTSDAALYLYDLTGRTVSTTDIRNGFSAIHTQVTSGIYIAVLKSNEGQMQEKIFLSK